MQSKIVKRQPLNKREYKGEGLQADSKPAQLAKLIFPAIIRMIRSKRSLAVEKGGKFTLDFAGKSRICVCVEDNFVQE